MAGATYLRLNPHLLATVRHSGHKLETLAFVAGFLSPQAFSRVLCSAVIPGTARNVERLHRLADVVGFAREQIFLDEFIATRRRHRNFPKYDDFSTMPHAPGAPHV